MPVWHGGGVGWGSYSVLLWANPDFFCVKITNDKKKNFTTALVVFYFLFFLIDLALFKEPNLSVRFRMHHDRLIKENEQTALRAPANCFSCDLWPFLG